MSKPEALLMSSTLVLISGENHFSKNTIINNFGLLARCVCWKRRVELSPVPTWRFFKQITDRILADVSSSKYWLEGHPQGNWAWNGPKMSVMSLMANDMSWILYFLLNSNKAYSLETVGIPKNVLRGPKKQTFWRMKWPVRLLSFEEKKKRYWQKYSFFCTLF